MAFQHNSKLADREPAWSAVDKTALPRIAFADMGEPDKKSTWRFPHHWVQGGTRKDENGIWVDGTLYLHRGGLIAAWAAANGARSGQEASPAVKAHLNAHRAAIGLESSLQDGALLTLDASRPTIRAGRRRVPRIVMEVYSGGPVEQRWSAAPVVVDLAGLRLWRDEGIPIYLNHDPDRILGHCTIAAKDGALICEGRLSGDPDLVELVVESHKRGFPWGVSIGATVEATRDVPDGESVEVNGRVLTGPLLVVTHAVLSHVALVGEPADPNSRATVIARREVTPMTDDRRVDPIAVEAVLAEGQAELERAIESETGAPASLTAEVRAEALRSIRDLKPQAIREQWSESELRAHLRAVVREAQLRLVRGSRPDPPKASPGQPSLQRDVIECALARQVHLPVERYYKPEVCEQADRLDISLGQLLVEAARANGLDDVKRITPANLRTVLQHAFPPVRGAFSYVDIGGILSNVANKLLQAGFQAVEQTWRQIAAIRPLRDFKTVTIYRLTDELVYKPVSPTGEIESGSLGEESYSLQARTYARMLVLTRADIINDDLGALQDIQTRLGRNAALALNNVFWATFLDNSTFFTSARGNLVTSVPLQISNMGAALKAFMELRDASGGPTGIDPRYLLVPPALYPTALQICNSTEVRDTTSNKSYGTTNVYKGLLTPITSRWIGSVYGGANGSDTTWYVIADPASLPVAVVGFVDGKETPTVEQAEADFSVLGIQFRGYYDFGCALAEWRAGVKCTA